MKETDLGQRQARRGIMGDMSEVEDGGGIFISYRRQQSSHFAGRLHDRLADFFGAGRVFMDVDAVKPGENFVEAIDRALAASNVLLVIMGPSWLAIADKQGRRRLDDPEDIVRLEIEAALSRDFLVVPVLVEGATMPKFARCPLAGLCYQHQ
jgi:TIR domain-containing protein